MLMHASKWMVTVESLLTKALLVSQAAREVPSSGLALLQLSPLCCGLARCLAFLRDQARSNRVA